MFVLGGTGRQVYATLCSNLLSVAYGTSIGWASTSMPFLESNATSLPSGPLTKDGKFRFQLRKCETLINLLFIRSDVSWIQSIFPVGGILGNNRSQTELSSLKASRLRSGTDRMGCNTGKISLLCVNRLDFRLAGTLLIGWVIENSLSMLDELTFFLFPSRLRIDLEERSRC